MAAGRSERTARLHPSGKACEAHPGSGDLHTSCIQSKKTWPQELSVLDPTSHKITCSALLELEIKTIQTVAIRRNRSADVRDPATKQQKYHFTLCTADDPADQFPQ
jgi:hypothetical protein